MKLYRPFPMGIEKKIKTKELLVTKTDMRGNIIDINDTFTKVTGYELDEIKGTPHDALRDPQMPEVILFLISKSIENGRKIRAIVKNLAKNGKYYWTITDFEPNMDKNGNIESFFAFRRVIPKSELNEIMDLYSILLDIEKKRGLPTALIYLEAYLQERRVSFDEYMTKMSLPKSIFKQLYISSFAPSNKEKAIYQKVA